MLAAAKKDLSIQRYKGLGEMNRSSSGNDDESREAHAAGSQIDDASRTDEIFTVLMGDAVEPRRKFIEDNAPGCEKPGRLSGKQPNGASRRPLTISFNLKPRQLDGAFGVECPLCASRSRLAVRPSQRREMSGSSSPRRDSLSSSTITPNSFGSRSSIVAGSGGSSTSTE